MCMCRALHPSSGSQFSTYDSDAEVMDAISSPPGSIRQGSSISESDWKEPSLQLCTRMGLQNYGSNSVYDAFQLMQTDTSIQVFSTLHFLNQDFIILNGWEFEIL